MYRELVFGFLFDQQIDECQSLWLIVRFRQQSAIAIEIISRVRMTHGTPLTLNPSVESVAQQASARKAAPSTICAALHPAPRIISSSCRSRGRLDATFGTPLPVWTRKWVPIGEPGSREALANFVAHLFAESLPARRPILLVDIEAVEDVEILEDRMAIACHGQDAKQFVRWFAGAGHFPSADGVGAIGRRKGAELCHVGGRQRSSDRVTEILAKLFQFRACHGGCSLSGGGRRNSRAVAD